MCQIITSVVDPLFINTARTDNTISAIHYIATGSAWIENWQNVGLMHSFKGMQ
jgi:hypothetical protein